MPPSYRRLQQWAIAISIASIIYNGAEGAISIAFGAESKSHALIFFGIQSAIEVASAAIVIWRFKSWAKPGEEKKTILEDHVLLCVRPINWFILMLKRTPASRNVLLLLSGHSS